MKVQLLFALAALAPCLCNNPPPSDPFPKPLILDIYQKDCGKTAFIEEPASTIDDGDLPNKDNPSYLKHLKWTSASDCERQFTLESGIGLDVQVSLPYPVLTTEQLLTYSVTSLYLAIPKLRILSIMLILVPLNPKASLILALFTSGAALCLVAYTTHTHTQNCMTGLRDTRIAPQTLLQMTPRTFLLQGLPMRNLKTRTTTLLPALN
jgi:hypothetical protein